MLFTVQIWYSVEENYILYNVIVAHQKMCYKISIGSITQNTQQQKNTLRTDIVAMSENV